MRKIGLLLFIGFMGFIGCKSGNPDDPFDICAKKANISSTRVMHVSDSDPLFWLETDTVERNCHGIFELQVRWANQERYATDTSKPPINLGFGTNFILGSGFPVDTIASDGSNPSAPSRIWIYKANQGAKNLSLPVVKYNAWLAYTQNAKPEDSVLVYARIDYSKPAD